MAIITIGNDVTDRASESNNGYTWLVTENKANNKGVLTSVSIWYAAHPYSVDTLIGTFYNTSELEYVSRDYANVGVVAAGSKQTFTGLNIDVEANDCIGWYNGNISNTIEKDNKGSTVRKSGNYFGATATYSAVSTVRPSIGGEGETVAVGSNFIYGVFKSPIFHSTIFRS